MPSLETRTRSALECLAAAKTEGDEMGQYVMALYQQLILHLRRPSHGRVLFTGLMVASMLHDAAGTGKLVAVFVFSHGPGPSVSACMCDCEKGRYSSSPARQRRRASQLAAIGKKLADRRLPCTLAQLCILYPTSPDSALRRRQYRAATVRASRTLESPWSKYHSLDRGRIWVERSFRVVPLFR